MALEHGDAAIDDSDEKCPENKNEEEPQEEHPLLKQLKALDKEYLQMVRDMQREIEEVRQKHLASMRPVLERRVGVLAASNANAESDHPLQGFWRQAIGHHPAFDGMLEEWDAPVLDCLRDIKCEQRDASDPKRGFRLEFHFGENPFFEEQVLWKEYISEEHSPYTGAIDVTEVKASQIRWKEGQDVTVHLVAKKSKKKRGGGAKKAPKPTVEPRSSFFRSFFQSLKEGEAPPEALVQDEDGELDEDDKAELVDGLIEQDHDLGCAFRDSLVPYAVRWFTGEAMPAHDGNSETSDEDEEACEVDEEEAEEEEDEDEENAEACSKTGESSRGATGSRRAVERQGSRANRAKATGSSKANSSSGSGTGAPGAPSKEDCKQQ